MTVKNVPPAGLPLSPAIVYFLFGMAIGPWGFDWVRVDPAKHPILIERLCELAVLISLFAITAHLPDSLRPCLTVILRYIHLIYHGKTARTLSDAAINLRCPMVWLLVLI